MNRYFIVKLTEYAGEQETGLTFVTELEPRQRIDGAINRIMGEWYMNEEPTRKDRDTWAWPHVGGGIEIVVDAVKRIPEDHFNVLKQYLSVL